MSYRGRRRRRKAGARAGDAEIDAERALLSIRVRGKLAQEVVRLYYGGTG